MTKERLELGERLMEIYTEEDTRYLKKIFTYLTLPEFTFLRGLERMASEVSEGKVYLVYLAEKLHLTIPQASKLVEQFQTLGLIYWTHDNRGSEGTYIYISEYGQEQMELQGQRLETYVQGLCERVGEEFMHDAVDRLLAFHGVLADEALRLE